MSKKENVIVGVVTGAVVGILLEILRGSGYWTELSAGWKAVLTGVFAVALFSGISLTVKKLKQGDTKKA